MPGGPLEPESSRPLDRDLYCLTCGYNLRGLSGDPIRCPECGNLNPIGDVEIPAEIISKQIRRMETSPAVCVGALLFGPPLMMSWCVLLVGELRSGYVDPWPCACVGLPAWIAVVAWIVGAVRFRDSCNSKPGWVNALVMYHVWGLLLIGTVIGPIVLVLPLCGRYVDRIEGAFPFALLLAIMVAFVVLMPALVFWVRWVYRRATAPLTHLQREVAVSIARERIRKKMARPRRGLFG